jgi:hypothetical protein
MTRRIVKKQNPNAPVRKPVSWKPASRTGTINAPKGYVVRWCHDTPENIVRKKLEGWEILDTNKFSEANVKDYEHRTTDSNGLTSSVLKRNELVAMILPEKMAEERKAYYEYETLDRTNSILDKSEVKKLISQGNPRNARNVHSLDAEGNFIID